MSARRRDPLKTILALREAGAIEVELNGDAIRARWAGPPAPPASRVEDATPRRPAPPGLERARQMMASAGMSDETAADLASSLGMGS